MMADLYPISTAAAHHGLTVTPAAFTWAQAVEQYHSVNDTVFSSLTNTTDFSADRLFNIPASMIAIPFMKINWITLTARVRKNTATNLDLMRFIVASTLGTWTSADIMIDNALTWCTRSLMYKTNPDTLEPWLQADLNDWWYGVELELTGAGQVGYCSRLHGAMSFSMAIAMRSSFLPSSKLYTGEAFAIALHTKRKCVTDTTATIVYRDPNGTTGTLDAWTAADSMMIGIVPLAANTHPGKWIFQAQYATRDGQANLDRPIHAIINDR